MPKYKYIGANPQGVTGKGGVPIHLEHGDVVEYVNYAPPAGVKFELYTGDIVPKHVFEKRVPVWDRVRPYVPTMSVPPAPRAPAPTLAAPHAVILPPVTEDKLTVELSTVPGASKKTETVVAEPEVLVLEPQDELGVSVETKDSEETGVVTPDQKVAQAEPEVKPMWESHQLKAMRKNELMALGEKHGIELDSKAHRMTLATTLHKELVKLELAE